MKMIWSILSILLITQGFSNMNGKDIISEQANESAAQKSQSLRKATFAGGCFWCMEPAFQNLKGVTDVVSGYSGGTKENPTYEQVSTGNTGHLEAVQVTFNMKQISYEKLLEVFWKSIDPTDTNGQFADKGTQYKTAIFYHNKKQKKLAEESKTTLQNTGIFKKPIVTEIIEFKNFYKAEDYHQDYYKKNPQHYSTYKNLSGRESFLKNVWGAISKVSRLWQQFAKPTEDELKKKLTPMQYQVTQKNATEPPYLNQYWTYKKEGIYVDIVSGEPLFISTDKFTSGCGWPSFTKPIDPNNIVTKTDTTGGTNRIEVRSKYANSHLGHLFDDGPKPTGLRYCINSASLRFIAKTDMEKEGYKEYLKLFDKE